MATMMLAGRTKLPRGLASACTRLPSPWSVQRPQYSTFITARIPSAEGDLPFTSSYCNLQQIRWKRKVGHRFEYKERKPSKKQRKKYHRELKAKFTSKHNPPGSKAGPRRQAQREHEQDLLDSDKPNTELTNPEEYGIGDALLDDLMGNSLGSQPTPSPEYFGHRHTTFYNRIQDNKDNATDQDISLLIRAYRDKHGTRRTKPIGLVAALSHVLQDVKVPLSSLGERSYTSLLTCCLSPEEGRRIFQLMRDQKRPISAYSWSILLDLYARAGDWRGCLELHHEMLQDGIAPTLASYTSLIACCARVCGDGRIAHDIRAEAAKSGWETWMEMFRSGIEADAMAYGALLRLWAARGLGERAIDTLEEMQRFDVKPTTLCFTSALKAIARSHATSIRYEAAWTKRFRRREQVTLHHGKMARSVLIMAESAGVTQDDGFVAALTQCAAVAGDMATAKAIYVASQLRREFGPRLRQIGPDEHLARLRGEEVPDKDTVDLLQGKNGEHYLTPQNRSRDLQTYESYAQREYGKDNRPLTAVLKACSNALQNQYLGSMWQGRENEGYLCVNSLRLIAEPRKPRMYDNTIPGQKITDHLTWDGEEYGEDRQKGKFSGVRIAEHAATSLDDLDEKFSKMVLDKDGLLKEEFRKATPEEVWKLKYGDLAEPNAAFMVEQGSDASQYKMKNPDHETGLADTKPVEKVQPKTSDLYFDSETMSWKSREETGSVAKEVGTKEDTVDDDDDLDFSDRITSFENRWKNPEIGSAANKDSDDEDGFDDGLDVSEESMFGETDSSTKGGTSSKVHVISDETVDNLSDSDSDSEASQSTEGQQASPLKNSEDIQSTLDKEEFRLFYEELCKEAKANNEEVTEEEAKELFIQIRGEYDEMMKMSNSELGLGGDSDNESDEDDEEDQEEEEEDDDDDQVEDTTSLRTENDRSSGGIVEQTAQFIDKAGRPGSQNDDAFASNDSSKSSAETDYSGELDDIKDGEIFEDRPSSDLSRLDDSNYVDQIDERDNAGSSQPTILDELRERLPTFPESRLVAIQRTFENNLTDPSLFDLVPLVRENMPDYVTASWLKRMAFLTSKFVVQKAAQDEVLDFNLVNGVLNLYASSGSLDNALKFHQNEFKRHNLKPNAYSDRLVLQMFLESNRFRRAMAFKKCVEKEGRHLDLKSYGSLVEYCSNRRQFGSALHLVRECVELSGSPPGEAYLQQFRLLGRQLGVGGAVGIEKLIGPDPLEWLREGRANRKYEMSYRGRKNVRMIEGKLLQI